MEKESILALDVSTKTGYAFAISTAKELALKGYGVLPQIHKPKGEYPGVYIDWSILCFNEIKILIDRFKPEVLIVEETSKGSKNAMSQKVLEYIHYNLAKYIKETNTRSTYLLTEQWRREIGCQMNDNEKLKNKAVRTYKKEFEKKNGKKTSIAYDINGKRIGLIGRKHVNIRRVSEIFEGQLKEPLKRKDEDLADGLGLAAAYHFRRFKKTDKAEIVSFEDLIKDNI